MNSSNFEFPERRILEITVERFNSKNFYAIFLHQPLDPLFPIFDRELPLNLLNGRSTPIGTENLVLRHIYFTYSQHNAIIIK